MRLARLKPCMVGQQPTSIGSYAWVSEAISIKVETSAPSRTRSESK